MKDEKNPKDLSAMADKMFAQDKAFHATASYFFMKLSMRFFNIYIAAIIVFAGGVLLEIYQKRKDIDQISFKDIIANTVGIIMADVI